MDTEFRFRRQSCRPLWDVSVRLTAMPAKALSVSADPRVTESIAPGALRAVLLGITTACSSVDDLQPFSISVVGIMDHSGTTSDLGFKACAEGAAYHLLGLPDRAPASGISPEA